jgi:hypothetical protein
MIKDTGLLHYGMYDAGLLKSAEMEKDAIVFTLAGIGSAIAWGLSAYGAYKAVTHNAPELGKHFNRGEYFSSPPTEDDPLGWGMAGEAIEGGLNVLPGAAAGKAAWKGGMQGLKHTFDKGNKARTASWFAPAPWDDSLSMLGEQPVTDYGQDSTSTVPHPQSYDTSYDNALNTTPTIMPQNWQSSSTPFNRGFQFEGNASSNQHRIAN